MQTTRIARQGSEFIGCGQTNCHQLNESVRRMFVTSQKKEVVPGEFDKNGEKSGQLFKAEPPSFRPQFRKQAGFLAYNRASSKKKETSRTGDLREGGDSKLGP